jgi:hypothetical protein
MPVVKTRLDDTSYQKLVRMRKEAGLPSVSALFLQKCGLLTDEREAREIVRRALTRAKRKPSGAEFSLRDLFPKANWEDFSKGARLRAGKMFISEIGLAVHGIRAGRKSSANLQYYVVA